MPNLFEGPWLLLFLAVVATAVAAEWVPRRCPSCGKRSGEVTLVCPACGKTLPVPARALTLEDATGWSVAVRGSQTGVAAVVSSRVLRFGLVGLPILLALYFFLAFFVGPSLFDARLFTVWFALAIVLGVLDFIWAFFGWEVITLSHGVLTVRWTLLGRVLRTARVAVSSSSSVVVRPSGSRGSSDWRPWESLTRVRGGPIEVRGLNGESVAFGSGLKKPVCEQFASLLADRLAEL